LNLIYLPHSYFLDLREATEKFWRINGQRLDSELGLAQPTFPNHIGPIASDKFETLERGFGVHAIVGLEDPREEEVRFLAPSAHEFLEVWKTLKYGMGAGGSDELANGRVLGTVFERGAE
jgi:hypothetical protein